MAELSRGQILKNPEIISGATGIGATIRLQDADKSAHIDIKTPDAITSSYTLTLPENDGNPGDVLVSTDGNGNLSFSAVPAAGSDTQITYNNAGSSAGAAVTTDSNNLYFDAGNGVIFEDNAGLHSKIQHAAAADIVDADNLIYNLPTDTPTSGEVLKVLSTSSASGNNTVNLHWATDETAAGATAAIGGDRAIQFSDAGFLGGSQAFTFQSDGPTLELDGNLFLGDIATPTDQTVGVATIATRLVVGPYTDATAFAGAVTAGAPQIILRHDSGSPPTNPNYTEFYSPNGSLQLDIGMIETNAAFNINALGTNADLQLSAARDVRLNAGGGTGNVVIRTGSSLEFANGSNTNFATLGFVSPTSNFNLTFPNDAGNQDDVLQRNATSGELAYVDNRKVANAVFYGGTNPIGLGSTIILSVPGTCSIIEARLIAGESDTMTVTVERSTAANITNPIWTDISNGGLTLSAAIGISDTTLTGWTTTLNRGDLLRFVVSSAPTNTVNATLSLILRPT